MTNLQLRTKKLQRLETKARALLSTTQNWRLLIAGLFFVALVIAASRPGSGIEAPAIFSFSIVFSLLVWRSRKLSTFAFRLKALSEFYDRQWRRQNGLSVARPWEQALNTPVAQAHQAEVSDLNLIGSHSLFTLLDETVSDGGRNELVRWILAPGFSASEIRKRQSLIQKLRRHRWLFIRLSIAAKETELELSTHQAIEFLKHPLLAPGANRWIAAVTATWAICMTAAIGLFANGQRYAVVFLATYMVLSFFAFQKIGPVFKRGVGLANHIGALMQLIRRIESAEKSEALTTLFGKIFRTQPSRGLRKFNFVLAFLSAETHPLVYLLLNAFLPWSAVFSWLLERERKKMSADFPVCLDELHRAEAFWSLSFLNVFQTQTFPAVQDKPALAFKSVFHPLILRDKVVANDFEFVNGKTLGLVTGSNMSGKSTYLRTVGVNQILANIGAPVFAQSFSTTAFRVGTCIQVSDSLRDGFSYFYSEVLRLSRLIEEVKSGKPVLFLIDEIFRGTNNRERQIGSRAVIRSLVNASSFGFVSTHDLELTNLEDSLPSVQNLHFREEIREGEMWFSYRLQTGPCPTTNALKIMERAGIDLSGS